MNKEFLKSISILYVEDENDVREFTSKLLGSLLKNVFTAEDGEKGLQIYEKNKDNIDLVITDINMPNMDGLEMSEKIKKVDKNIPIIVTSAHNNASFLRKAIDVGVSSYAMKPIDLYQLVTSLIKAMEPIIVKRKVNQLDVNAVNFDENLNSIINDDNNLIMIYNKDELIKVNNKFLDYFNYNTLEIFLNNHNNAFDLFENEYGYISKKNLDTSNWIEYLKNLPELDRSVKIKNKEGTNNIFTLDIDSHKNKPELHMLTLSDVTNLKEKSNLIEYHANYNRLTGLYNKNKFLEFYSKEIRRARRYENKMSLIVFSIDSHNIKISDNILKEVINIVVSNLREHDLIGHLNDELFSILLPETSLSGADTVSKKIFESVLNSDLGKEGLHVKIKLGTSELSAELKEEEFIKKALLNMN